MKLREYIQKKISQLNLGVSDEMADEMIKLLDLDGDGDVDMKSVDLFFYHVIPDILTIPSRVSEGDFSLSYDKDAIIAYYRMLAKRLGLEDILSNENKITDITHRW